MPPIVSLATLPVSTVLALNNAHARETSHLEPADLDRMLAMAFHATAVTDAGQLEAFLITFDQDAAYRSPNFVWFQGRLPRFVYVDRIVTAPEARGRGHARRLYRDLLARASAAGHDRVTCEVNRVPPNPGSDAFHEAIGFTEVGRATSADGAKTVRYLELALS